MSSSTDARGSRRTIVSLGAIVVLGFALRLAYLAQVTSQPGFVWDDPDSYAANAEWLARSGSAFDFRVVEHDVDGRRYVLPPLYPFFLSVFARFPGYPFNAQVAQIVLSTLGIALVFLLGREVHSKRAGLLAAGIACLWLPNIIAVWSTMQEALYVPLVLLGFALLLAASGKESGTVRWGAAGVVFGLAALTRSMPLYYIPVATALLLWQRGVRKGVPAALALVLGFGAFTVPYSVVLSSYLDAPTFIENHGGIRVAAEHGVEGVAPPGVVATAATLMRAFVSDPAETARGWASTARSILHVNGGRLLQIYLAAETKSGSIFWKAAAHGLADLPLVLALVLAPFGFALCRRPEAGAFLVFWIAVNLGLTVLSGFGGSRLRVPFEPHLWVLASVVVAGGFRPARRWVFAAAAGVSLVAASVVLPQLGSSLRAQGDYGVDWPLDPVPKRSAMTGRAGFNVLAVEGVVEYWVRPRNENPTTVLAVSLNGEPAERVVVDSEHRFRHPWPVVDLVRVELEVSDESTGTPVRALVVVPGLQPRAENE